MLAIDVELLTGRYVATRFNDRTRVEWPPHPARLFSAAVAAWADAEEPDPEERDALLWWESLLAPEIECSWGEAWSERAPVTHYVPVNDTQVVGRDTSDTYRKLRDARDEVAGDDGESEKSSARTRTRLNKLETKASEDSLRVASGGSAPTSALQVLPASRQRQARVYPTAIPENEVVTYLWPTADAADPHVAVLDGLLGRIPRLGHSSSLVSVSTKAAQVSPDPPPEADGPQRVQLAPSEAGRLPVRVAGAGQLASLETAFLAHQGTEPRVLPAEIVTYAPVGPDLQEAPTSVFGTNWIVVEPIDDRFGIRDTLALTRTLRSALMKHSLVQPAPEIISGHLPGPTGSRTAPTNKAHLAIVALPFVAHRHADGGIRGLALLVPEACSSEDRTLVLRTLGNWLEDGAKGGGNGELQLGHMGVARFRRSVPDEASAAARPTRWTRASRRWASVTPVALDRFPGDFNDSNPGRRDATQQRAEDLIRKSCDYIGLPAPAEVSVGSTPPVLGTRKAGAFPPYAVQGGKLRRTLVHVELVFAEPVRGPVLLGAGRYLGYGLCAPLPDHDRRTADHG